MTDGVTVGDTEDFIFGTLATDDLRLAALRDRGRFVRHDSRSVPIDPAPGKSVELLVDVGPEVAASAVFVWYTTDGSSPTTTFFSSVFFKGYVVWDTLLWASRQRWTGRLPPSPPGTLVRYHIAAQTPAGELVWADPDPWTGVPGRFAYHVDHDRVPDWARDAVIYHLFVDRFAPSTGQSWNDAQGLDGFWGGTLRGVIERLPYFSDLSVDCLWLSPIFPSPSHHGYDATDYHAIEPRLGSEADLRELVDAAHVRGIRVLLDFVANHLSSNHPIFRRAADHRDAPERRWFSFDRAGGYRSFFGVDAMPRIDCDHEPAGAYLIDSAIHWLSLGVDGFRLDYANGPSHAFWSRFRAAVRAAKPDALLIGEVVETAELQRSYAGRLDGTLDFLLLQQMRAFFAFATLDALAFASFLDRHFA